MNQQPTYLASTGNSGFPSFLQVAKPESFVGSSGKGFDPLKWLYLAVSNSSCIFWVSKIPVACWQRSLSTAFWTVLGNLDMGNSGGWGVLEGANYVHPTFRGSLPCKSDFRDLPYQNFGESPPPMDRIVD